MLIKKLLMLVVVATTMAFSTSSVVVENPFDSVRPLSMIQVDASTGEDFRKTICTVFAVKMPNGQIRWLTSAHCIIGMETLDIWIGKSPAKIITISTPFDVAVLSGEIAPGLTIAVNASPQTEAIRIIGYSFGWETPQYREGIRVGQFRQSENSIWEDTDQIAVAPGDSGSPVLNTSMHVVGMMKRAFCGGQVGFCPMGGSVTLPDLKFVLAMRPIPTE